MSPCVNEEAVQWDQPDRQNGVEKAFNLLRQWRDVYS